MKTNFTIDNVIEGIQLEFPNHVRPKEHKELLKSLSNKVEFASSSEALDYILFYDYLMGYNQIYDKKKGKFITSDTLDNLLLFKVKNLKCSQNEELRRAHNRITTRNVKKKSRPYPNFLNRLFQIKRIVNKYKIIPTYKSHVIKKKSKEDRLKEKNAKRSNILYNVIFGKKPIYDSINKKKTLINKKKHLNLLVNKNVRAKDKFGNPLNPELYSIYIAGEHIKLIDQIFKTEKAIERYGQGLSFNKDVNLFKNYNSTEKIKPIIIQENFGSIEEKRYDKTIKRAKIINLKASILADLIDELENRDKGEEISLKDIRKKYFSEKISDYGNFKDFFMKRKLRKVLRNENLRYNAKKIEYTINYLRSL